MFRTGHASPSRGKSTTVDPITTLDDLAKVKALVAHDVRLNALWFLATNSALRASDLVRLQWTDFDADGVLTVIERKTGKRRVIPLNAATVQAVRAWQQESAWDHVFTGQRGVLTVGSWGRQVKDLCGRAGIKGKHCSHTCRKTFVRLQHDAFGTSLPTLMTMLNHSSQAQTLQYMGRLSSDVQAAYSNSL